MMMKKLSLLFVLLATQSFAQYFNTVEFESERIPKELSNVDDWLAPFVNQLFYTGTVGNYNFDGYFQIVTRKDSIALELPSTGIIFSLNLGKPGSLRKSPEMKMRYQSMARKMSRWGTNFEFHEMERNDYLYDFVLDINRISDRQLLEACLKKYGKEKKRIPRFLKRTNAVFGLKLQLHDLEKYRFDDENPSRETDEIDRLVALLNDQVGGLHTIEKVVYQTTIKTKDEEKLRKNVAEFLTAVAGKDYMDDVYKMLQQEFTFRPFAVKIHFGNIITTSDLKDIPLKKDSVFTVDYAEFNIIPSKDDTRFDMLFEGSFNNLDCKKVHVVIKPGHVLVEGITEQGNIEFYNARNNLKKQQVIFPKRP